MASIGSDVLPPAELTTINSKSTFELIENTAASFKGSLTKNSDGRQTSSEVKPGRASLVTTLKQTRSRVVLVLFSSF